MPKFPLVSLSWHLGEKVHFVKRHLGIISSFHSQDEGKLARDFTLHYLKDDGVFVARLLSVNSSDLVVTEVINQLWTRFKTVNQLCSSSQNQHQTSNDNMANTNTLGTNINYHNDKTSMNNASRQRISRIPPLTLPSILNRTIHQVTNNKLGNFHDNTKSAKDTDV